MGIGLWPEQNEPLIPAALFDDRTTVRAHVEYQTDPIGWAVDKLLVPERTIRWSLNAAYDTHQWDGSVDPLVELAEALRDWKSVGCESGTGTGKSFWLAVLILWFLAAFEGSRVFTFAPKEDQLRLYIWMEIGKLWPLFSALFPTAILTDLEICMLGQGQRSWAAKGYAVGIVAGEGVSVKASGMHAEHMLLVYEETPGIPLPVLEAGENTCTAPHNIRVAIGNPNHRLDSLHKFCTSPGNVHIRMSSLDHPNVVEDDPTIVPGAVSRQAIERRRLKYGESSPVYLSRVRGESPDQASDALIRLEWLVRSDMRYQARKLAGTLPTRVTGKGVDVANSEHGDKACIADFGDDVVLKIDAFQCPDANLLGARVSNEMDKTGLAPERVGVDATGVGAGTVNELRRLKKIVQALHSAARPIAAAERGPTGSLYEWVPDANLFRHLRDQMLWQLREDLRLDALDMERNDELWEELTTPTFVDEPRTIIMAKDDIKEILGRSPDRADALMLGNWVRKRHYKPIKEPPHKIAHRAQPFVVKDGKLLPSEREPTTVEELIASAGKRRGGSMVPGYSQMVPRNKR